MKTARKIVTSVARGSDESPRNFVKVDDWAVENGFGSLQMPHLKSGFASFWAV